MNLLNFLQPFFAVLTIYVFIYYDDMVHDDGMYIVLSCV